MIYPLAGRDDSLSPSIKCTFLHRRCEACHIFRRGTKKGSIFRVRVSSYSPDSPQEVGEKPRDVAARKGASECLHTQNQYTKSKTRRRSNSGQKSPSSRNTWVRNVAAKPVAAGTIAVWTCVSSSMRRIEGRVTVAARKTSAPTSGDASLLIRPAETLPEPGPTPPYSLNPAPPAGAPAPVSTPPLFWPRQTR